MDPLQSEEWWLGAVGADRVTPPGPGVPITIVDSGVDPTQPEFAARPDTTFLNEQTVTGRSEFHGTAVASVAAAPANGVNLVGVYPTAALQIWDASPLDSIRDFSAANGIVTAARHCPGVINLSFGGSSADPELEYAIQTAFHRGCLVVAAAGNSGDEGNPPTYPADYPHVLTVGATDENDLVLPFSTHSAAVDLAAPGVDILGAVPLSHDPNGYESGLDGTSFSAPIVSAAAAWVWTARPTLDVAQLFQVLRESARDVGPPGFDPGSGFGIVDIPAALAAPTPPRDPDEPNDDVDEVRPGGLFASGEPALTTPAKPSVRISAQLDAADDPRDVYRIWVPANRTVRATISSDGDAVARIWGPTTASVGEGVAARRRDLRGAQVRAGKRGLSAYVEVLLTGRTSSAGYVLTVRAARR
jgi:hypothetical protein